MASPTQWTWVWVSSRSWWWTGKPSVLQSIGSLRVGHDWVIELNWTEYMYAAAKSLQSCLTLCNPLNSSPPGSPVPGILQARILDWFTISFSRGSSWARNQFPVSCIVVKWALAQFLEFPTTSSKLLEYSSHSLTYETDNPIFWGCSDLLRWPTLYL